MKIFRYKISHLILLSIFFTIPLNAENLCSNINAYLEKITKIRKLEFKKKVKCEVHSKEQIRNYILKTIDETIPEEKIKNEEFIYRELGFLPKDYDYKKGVLDFYTNEMAGYYNPETKSYVMAEWIPMNAQTHISVHELTHALQDQYHNLKAITDPLKFTTDELFARSALIEGDATFLMFDYLSRENQEKSITETDNIRSIFNEETLTNSATKKVPKSLITMFNFAYLNGFYFNHYFIRKYNYLKIDNIFNNLPKTSEEILHPEKYNQNDFKLVKDEELISEGERILYSDSLGEISIRALFNNFIRNKKKISEASSGWGGDRVAIVESDGSKKVVWKIIFDTKEDVLEFQKLYQKTKAPKSVMNLEDLSIIIKS